jgi:hypothetical protein
LITHTNVQGGVGMSTPAAPGADALLVAGRPHVRLVPPRAAAAAVACTRAVRSCAARILLCVENPYGNRHGCAEWQTALVWSLPGVEGGVITLEIVGRALRTV